MYRPSGDRDTVAAQDSQSTRIHGLRPCIRVLFRSIRDFNFFLCVQVFVNRFSQTRKADRDSEDSYTEEHNSYP